MYSVPALPSGFLKDPMRAGLYVLLLFFLSLASPAAEIRGKVTNAVGGEALGRVEVSVLGTRFGTITTAAGEFTITGLPVGSYILRLDAVGYRLVTIPYRLAAISDIKEFSITMVPDNFHHADQVEVRGDLFQVSDSPATAEMNLTSSEIRGTSTVLADDPFRSVQTGATGTRKGRVSDFSGGSGGRSSSRSAFQGITKSS